MCLGNIRTAGGTGAWIYSNKPVLRHAWVLRQTDISHSPVAPLPPNSLVRCYYTFPGPKCRLLGYIMSPLFFLARIMVNLRVNFGRLRSCSSPGSKISVEAQTCMYARYCRDLRRLYVCTSKQQMFSVLTRYATLVDMSAKCMISHIRVSDIVGYARLDENIAALGKIKADEGPIQAR